jgi:hypothetical protein
LKPSLNAQLLLDFFGVVNRRHMFEPAVDDLVHRVLDDLERRASRLRADELLVTSSWMKSFITSKSLAFSAAM